jgi:hypothetical protein
MKANINIGNWVRSYGGRINHLISGYGPVDSITGLSSLLFVCGAKSAWSEWGYDPGKARCSKCQRGQQSEQQPSGLEGALPKR